MQEKAASQLPPAERPVPLEPKGQAKDFPVTSNIAAEATETKQNELITAELFPDYHPKQPAKLGTLANLYIPNQQEREKAANIKAGAGYHAIEASVPTIYPGTVGPFKCLLI